MSTPPGTIRPLLIRESALFFILLFLGFVIMPIAIYFVGQTIFGDYDGRGYGEFFNLLSGRIRSADPVAWFLALAPYLAVQVLRLTAFGWRLTARPQG